MSSLVDLLNLAKGYRTYLSAAAAILTAVATVAGIISPTNGAVLGAACLAVAQIFQRMATADSQLSLAQLVADLTELKDAAKPIFDAAQQTTDQQKS